MSQTAGLGNPQEDNMITTTTASRTAEPLLLRGGGGGGSSHNKTKGKDTALDHGGKISSQHAASTKRTTSRTARNMFRSRKVGEASSSATSSTPSAERKRRRRKSRSRRSSANLSDGTTGGVVEYTSLSSSSVGSPSSSPSSSSSMGQTRSFTSTRARGGLCRALVSRVWRWLTRSPAVAANSIPTHQASFTTPRTSRWMGFLARCVLWTTIVSSVIGVIWYSVELFHHGADPHLVVWFSAGGFVLLGFPISMWAIIKHLANYNQPHVQVYIVRILWMVPLYSVGSWLAMRFRSYAIYIETVRDLYESYVLYSFLQFLIQVLGGEEALVLMLKDKSPTRGVHMWGLQWCVKPWLMGQPYRKTVYERENSRNSRDSVSKTLSSAKQPGASMETVVRSRVVKRVMWKSPFFVKCKFGVLQYVLLKFLSAICIMILEHLGWYHEGDFTPRGGYLYICFLTNLSQCWALYCLVLFYYATHNELSPIRPVGKFLSVKALVFFTWWQSVMISYLLWMDMIPAYSMKRQDWTSEDVAKGLQDYLICVEMFVIAIVHSFVFPHSEYTPQAVEARSRALNLAPMTQWNKRRLGRTRYSSQYLLFGRNSDDNSNNTQSLGTDVETELVSLNSETDVSGWTGQNSQFGAQFTSESPQDTIQGNNSVGNVDIEEGNLSAQEELRGAPSTSEDSLRPNPATTLDPGVDMTEQDDEEDDGEYEDDDDDDEYMDHGDDSDGDAVFGESEHDEELTNTTEISTNRPGFMDALLASAIPTDMVDSTVGIVKGEYNIERKTLLNHATVSDQYDLFSPSRRPFAISKKDPQP